MLCQQSQSIYPMSGASGGVDMRQINVDKTPQTHEDEKASHVQEEDWQSPTTQSLK